MSRYTGPTVASRQAKSGSGAFRWNAAAWFGSQLGGTLWLLLYGALLVGRDVPLGLLVLVLGLVANVVGVVLWSRRDRMAPYPAIQSLLLAIGVCGLAAVVAVHRLTIARGLDRALLEQPRRLYWGLLLIPAIMVLFHLAERGGRRAAARAGKQEKPPPQKQQKKKQQQKKGRR